MRSSAILFALLTSAATRTFASPAPPAARDYRCAPHPFGINSGETVSSAQACAASCSPQTRYSTYLPSRGECFCSRLLPPSSALSTPCPPDQWEVTPVSASSGVTPQTRPEPALFVQERRTRALRPRSSAGKRSVRDDDDEWEVIFDEDDDDDELARRDERALRPRASGLTRRMNPNGVEHAPHARRSGLKRAVELCPAGKDACLIPGTGEYECINTQSELESCGGCVNGHYGWDTAPSGMDCSSMVGVRSGASTCSAGVCQAMACLRGFTLVAGTCVSDLLILQ